MRRALPALAALAAALAAGQAAGAQVLLRYRGPIGQVREYRLSLRAEGEQVSLGERRPVHVEAEFALREEVVATGPADSFVLRVSARALKAKDPTGTFGSGQRSRFPPVEVRLSPRGEILEARPVSPDLLGPAERAFAALMTTTAALPILPEGPVSPGDRWRSQQGKVAQEARLASVARRKSGEVATISSLASGQIALDEESGRLGLTTSLSGEESVSAELDLLMDAGVVITSKGEARVRTNGEMVLALPEGARRFPVASEMRISFHLRLVSIDGRPVAAG